MRLVPRKLRRPWIKEKITYHYSPGECYPYKTYTVHKLPAIVTPYPRWFEHPIYWWKMRHLRHDIKVMEEAVDPAFKQKLDEELDRAFLFGDGGI